MLSFLVTYREAYDEITANRETNLRDYELSEEEWKILKDLSEVLKVCDDSCNFILLYIMFLQVFKDATLFFSRSTPNLAKVIPAMDHIDRVLATASINKKYPWSIQAAVAIGKSVLNKYYDRTDHSEVYRIAMSEYFVAICTVSHARLTCSSSLTPKPQARLLQGSRMGRQLDQRC